MTPISPLPPHRVSTTPSYTRQARGCRQAATCRPRCLAALHPFTRAGAGPGLLLISFAWAAWSLPLSTLPPRDQGRPPTFRIHSTLGPPAHPARPASLIFPNCSFGTGSSREIVTATANNNGRRTPASGTRVWRGRPVEEEARCCLPRERGRSECAREGGRWVAGRRGVGRQPRDHVSPVAVDPAFTLFLW